MSRQGEQDSETYGSALGEGARRGAKKRLALENRSLRGGAERKEKLSGALSRLGKKDGASDRRSGYTFGKRVEKPLTSWEKKGVSLKLTQGGETTKKAHKRRLTKKTYLREEIGNQVGAWGRYFKQKRPPTRGRLAIFYNTGSKFP